MPLQATHIRFSLAIKDDLRVSDTEKYVAGAIYPDTRYLSGVNRKLSHDPGYFAGRKDPSDFEKGWLSHIIADAAFYELVEAKFGDLILYEDYERQALVLSAIKIIQDMADFRAFDIRPFVGYLDYYELHFHEDERKVIEYAGIIKKMYAGKTKIEVGDYLLMRAALGRTEANNARLREKIIELYREEEIIENIDGNFEDMMDIYRDKYRGDPLASFARDGRP